MKKIMNKSIIIRKVRKSDTNKIIKWRNCKHVMDVFIDRNPLTKETHLDWYENKIKKGKVVQFVMVDKRNNKEFGSAYLRDIDYKNSKAEYGIFIGEESYLGKGYGCIVTKQVMNYAFDKLNLNKVYARVLKKNKASFNMFKKLGFKKEALFKEDVSINDLFYDVYFVSMLKRNWKSNEK